MAANVKKLLVTIMFLSVYGCTNNRSSLETYQQTSRIDQDLTTAYQSPNSSNEEYINRIAKRIIMTSDEANNKYHFVVLSSTDPMLSIDDATHTLSISHGALAQLKDEAELAAIITLGMKIIDRSNNIDRATAIDLSKAGYDPQGMLDLQEEYFYASNNINKNWLKAVFPVFPTAGSISANRVMIQKMPKGLLRNAENYSKQING